MENPPSNDAYAPAQIAERVETVGVAKARMALRQLLPLSILAGAFIGFGALGFVLVKADSTLGFALGQLLGGLLFSIGLLLVVVAGAELFTGNNLLAMAWADRRISSRALLRNWGWVALGNAIGAIGLAWLVYRAGHAQGQGGAIAEAYLRIARAKLALTPEQAFLRGVLCNMLVCMAVWMSLAGRSVVDKAVAVVFPVTLFVAAGFEHSIANLYLLPLALWLQDGGAADPFGWLDIARNLALVIPGNLLGGSVLVGLVYYLIYRPARTPEG